MEQSYDYISVKSISTWVNNFLVQVKICRSLPDEYQYKKIGEFLSWSFIRSKKGYKALDFGITENKYVQSRKRFIAID